MDLSYENNLKILKLFKKLIKKIPFNVFLLRLTLHVGYLLQAVGNFEIFISEV